MRPLRRLALAYARLRYGKVPEPLSRWSEHGGVFWAWSVEELVAEATWRSVPRGLRDLAVLKAASAVDCPWCLDFGSHVAAKAGLREEQLRDLHRWRESPAYDEAERDVLAYADALSATPIATDDALVSRLRERHGEKGLVELTALIALENQRSRFNAAMGVLPQGWSRVCALPSNATAARSV